MTTQRGKREEHVREAHQRLVNLAPGKAGHQANGGTQGDGEHQHDDGGQERVAGSEDDPAENVAPPVVGAEPVGRGRGQEPVLGIERDGVRRREYRRGNRDQDQGEGEEQPDHANGIGAQPSAELPDPTHRGSLPISSAHSDGQWRWDRSRGAHEYEMRGSSRT